MKFKLLLLIGIIFTLGSCAQSNKQKSFEGTITYKITVTTKSDNANYNEYQKQEYGDKVKITIAKNGSFKRDFLTSGTKGYALYDYNATTNTSFIKLRNIDTIYSENCTENSLEFVSEKDLPNETINGQLCEGYFISGIEPRGGQHISMSHFYPKDKEYIDPLLYKDYKEFFFNKIIEKMKAPFYKLIMDMGRYTVTYDIESIQNHKVNSYFINLPVNVPRKESKRY